MRSISNFVETSEKVTITFSGWDGKSYNGEGRSMKVWYNQFVPGKKFVCLWDSGFGRYIVHEVEQNLHPVSNLPMVHVFVSFERSCMNK